MSAQIHVEDEGTVFEATIYDENNVIVDLSSATTMEFRFRKANGTVLTVDAIHVTDGTDGKIKYTAVEGDIDVDGQWKLQAYVELPNGKWHSSFHDFVVYENAEG